MKEIPRNLTIEDDQGKHLEAIKVISKSINYLRGHLMEQIVKRDIQIKKTEITWVLTVPAIWSDPAKQFMREAAVEVINLYVVIIYHLSISSCKDLGEVGVPTM